MRLVRLDFNGPWGRKALPKNTPERNDSITVEQSGQGVIYFPLASRKRYSKRFYAIGFGLPYPHPPLLLTHIRRDVRHLISRHTRNRRHVAKFPVMSAGAVARRHLKRSVAVV